MERQRRLLDGGGELVPAHAARLEEANQRDSGGQQYDTADAPRVQLVLTVEHAEVVEHDRADELPKITAAKRLSAPSRGAAATVEAT